jgi:hypothetical protein
LVDIPWLLLTAVVLPLAVWWLRAVRERQRRARLARYAESSALHRLVIRRTFKSHGHSDPLKESHERDEGCI